MGTVEVLDLCVGHGTETVLDRLTFQVPMNASLLVLGHNGTGKTTLLRTLFGLLPAIRGQASLVGVDVRQAKPTELIQAGVRFLGQGPRSFDELRVKEHRNALGKLYGWQSSQIQEATTSSSSSSRKVGVLSIGQRRVEALMLLRCGRPKLFLLDEPTAGLDVGNTDRIIDWIADARKDGVSFIIAEHNFRPLLELLEFTVVVRRNKVSYVGPSRTLCDDAVLAQHLF